MRVLLTGATGLLGSHVAHELVKRNYQVRVLVRPESSLNALEGLAVDVFKGYLTREKDVEEATDGCNFVIHSAALAVHKPTFLEAFQEVNIDGTRFIINACKKKKVEKLVYVSTANCFASGSKLKPGDESGAFPDWMQKSGYAYSKYLAQQQVLNDVRSGNLDAVVVNPTFIVGKDYKVNGGKIFNYILNKRIAFYPLGGKNFIDAEAAAVGIVNAMEKGRSGECYLLAGENLSYRRFFNIVKGYTGQRTIMLPMPRMILKLAGFVGDILERIFNVHVPLTLVNARMLCQQNYYTAAKAKKELGLPNVSAEQSIGKTLQWFKVNKGINHSKNPNLQKRIIEGL